MSIFSKKTNKDVVKRENPVKAARDAHFTNIIIKQPYITEKSMMFQGGSQYEFIVDTKASKPEIRKQIEKLYKVNVEKVRTINKFNKPQYFRNVKGKGAGKLKKAIVFLKKGQKIDISSNR